MLVPQGGALDSEKPAEPAQEDDLVQKAFTVLNRKDVIARQLAKPQASSFVGFKMSWAFLLLLSIMAT